MRKFNYALASQDGLRDEDICDYKTCIDFIQKIQKLREHLESQLVSEATLMQNIHSELHKRSVALNEEPLHSSLVEVYLHNLQILKNSFKELESQYIGSCKNFEERCEKVVQSARELISTNDFQNVAEIILTISKSSHVLKDHLGEVVEEKYRNIVKMLLQHLSRFSRKADLLLAKIRLSDSDLEILKNYVEILRSAQENSALQDRISTYVEKLRRRTDTSEKHTIGCL